MLPALLLSQTSLFGQTAKVTPLGSKTGEFCECLGDLSLTEIQTHCYFRMADNPDGAKGKACCYTLPRYRPG
jgi:hypothetical protein